MQVLAQLRDQLARRRAAGDDFGQAWEAALPHALAGVDAEELGEWLEALAGTRRVWEDAYRGKRTGRRERALSLIGDPADREPLPEALGPCCARCGAPIPDGRRSYAALYCSGRCRRRASEERLAAV